MEKSGGVRSLTSQAYYTLAEESSLVALYDQQVGQILHHISPGKHIRSLTLTSCAARVLLS